MRQEGLLLPDVYNYFLEEMNACAIIDTSSENKQVLTARWVLSILTSSPQHHLSYVCKVRKYSTLLYRTNGDVLVALTNALHRLSNIKKTDTCTIQQGGRQFGYMHTTQHRSHASGSK